MQAHPNAASPITEIVADVLAEIESEVLRAFAKFSPFNSAHEGWAVIQEESDELWDEVKANRGYDPTARTEAIQVAAMAVRYVVDVSDGRTA